MARNAVRKWGWGVAGVALVVALCWTAWRAYDTAVTQQLAAHETAVQLAVWRADSLSRAIRALSAKHANDSALLVTTNADAAAARAAFAALVARRRPLVAPPPVARDTFVPLAPVVTDTLPPVTLDDVLAAAERMRATAVADSAACAAALGSCRARGDSALALAATWERAYRSSVGARPPRWKRWATELAKALTYLRLGRALR